MANAHVHEIFRRILEPLMSKPRTQAELDAQTKLDEQWNASARQADATWWRQPHERGVGRTYERFVFKGDQGPVMVEQIEDWK